MVKVNPNPPELTPQEIQQFWDKVDQTTPFGPDGDCWRWTAGLISGGYGNISYRRINRNLLAHRLAYFLHYGRWPSLLVCHHCDNTVCVNPLHLFKGTQQNNLDDRERKGRTRRGINHWMTLEPERVARVVPRGADHPMHTGLQKPLRGEKNGSSKITEEIVRLIRRTSANGTLGTEIAKTYGISRSQVSNIILRHAWKHVL